jgi:hypothetical protein
MSIEYLPVTATESDVEQKVIFPLLTEILGFLPAEIKTKDYLAPTDIDKGAGKKAGYYPDYIIYLAGIPVLVVEAKDPSTACEAGYREARLYASELNKRFPADVNPASQVLACNGTNIMFGPWDTEDAVETHRVSDLTEGLSVLEHLKATQGKKALYYVSQQLRGLLTPSRYYKPLRMIGGPARQHETIPPNAFAADLAPLLRRFFDPDETAHSEEVIKRGYCSTDELTKYNATLDSLLKDRIPKHESFSTVKTTRHSADLVDGALKKAIGQQRDVPDPFIMVVGGVGAGKSMFIERYLRYLIDPEIKQDTIWVTVNFNEAPSDLSDVETWICHQFVQMYSSQIADDNPLSFDNLKRYFSPDISSRRDGVYKLLYRNNKKEYELRLSDDLSRWTDDPIKLCTGIIRYHVKDRGIPVVVVFDNVDRRERDQQLQVFQAVQWFRHKNKCFSLLSLRDETFDAYKEQPPLDAFLKPFAFRITAPSFVTVARKRLELAIEHLTKNAEKTQTFTLASGAVVTYPTDNLGRYLMAIYISIFHPRRSIRVILEALSGRNIRRALEMFAEILMSGYLPDWLLFSISEGRTRTIAEWQIIRVLMRTNYRYFASEHGYVTNLFDIPEEGKTANNFLMIEVLEFLVVNRKKHTEFQLEGYFNVSQILDALSSHGYSVEDLMWALERCLNQGLIIADHQRTKNLAVDDYVKVSAAGFYHVRFLAKRAEYLANIPIDTFISDREKAERITKISTDKWPHTEERLSILRDYLVSERARYGDLFPAFLHENDPSAHHVKWVDEALHFISTRGGQDQLEIF